MAVTLPPHKHCPNCEGPIPETKDYCSEECMVKSQINKKRGSRKMLVFYIVAAIALVAIWVLSFVRF
jgi:predicted nucleic acid-binding Zn ribbon protein